MTPHMPVTHMVMALATAALLGLTAACGSTVAITGTAPAGGLPAEPGLTTDPLQQDVDLGQIGGSTPLSPQAGPLTGPAVEVAPQASTPGRSGPAAPGALPTTGPAAPGSRISSPLVIGVLAAGDTQQGAAQAGADSGTSTSASKAMRVLADHYRVVGGMAGRPVKIVFREIPVTTTNYDTELTAACAYFTQDNKSEIVLSQIGYYKAVLEACLQKKSVPHIEGAWGVTDDVDFRTYPNYYTPGMPSYDSRYRSTIAAGVASGKLTRGMKVGVVVEDCPFINRAYTNAFRPAARAAGLLIDEFHKKCTEGFQDAGAIASAGQAAASRFAINGAQTVMFATYPTGVDLTFFSQAANSQGYRPAYYLDSLATTQTLVDTGNMPRQQAEKVNGLGWMIALDTTGQSFTRPAQKRCLGILKPKLSITRQADYEIAFAACDTFFLLEAAMQRSAGSVRSDDLRAAVASFGTSHEVAANVGRSSFAANKRYGQSEGRTFGYTASCRCIRYSGPARGYS